MRAKKRWYFPCQWSEGPYNCSLCPAPLSMDYNFRIRENFQAAHKRCPTPKWYKRLPWEVHRWFWQRDSARRAKP